jgi:hypothetical protein
MISFLLAALKSGAEREARSATLVLVMRAGLAISIAVAVCAEPFVIMVVAAMSIE